MKKDKIKKNLIKKWKGPLIFFGITLLALFYLFLISYLAITFPSFFQDDLYYPQNPINSTAFSNGLNSSPQNGTDYLTFEFQPFICEEGSFPANNEDYCCPFPNMLIALDGTCCFQATNNESGCCSEPNMTIYPPRTCCSKGYFPSENKESCCPYPNMKINSKGLCSKTYTTTSSSGLSEQELQAKIDEINERYDKAISELNISPPSSSQQAYRDALEKYKQSIEDYAKYSSSSQDYSSSQAYQQAQQAYAQYLAQQEMYEQAQQAYQQGG